MIWGHIGAGGLQGLVGFNKALERIGEERYRTDMLELQRAEQARQTEMLQRALKRDELAQQQYTQERKDREILATYNAARAAGRATPEQLALFRGTPYAGAFDPAGTALLSPHEQLTNQAAQLQVDAHQRRTQGFNALAEAIRGGTPFAQRQALGLEYGITDVPMTPAERQAEQDRARAQAFADQLKLAEMADKRRREQFIPKNPQELQLFTDQRYNALLNDPIRRTQLSALIDAENDAKKHSTIIESYDQGLRDEAEGQVTALAGVDSRFKLDQALKEAQGWLDEAQKTGDQALAQQAWDTIGQLWSSAAQGPWAAYTKPRFISQVRKRVPTWVVPQE